MIERTQADWDALCTELGRLGGDVIVYRRAVADLEARLARAVADEAARGDTREEGLP